jgi:hypothetical protein
MSQQYEKELAGVMFANDKEGNENRPDWKGSIQIEGVEYWLSGWHRTTLKGELISLKAEKKKTAMAALAKAEEPVPFDDDIPF